MSGLHKIIENVQQLQVLYFLHSSCSNVTQLPAIVLYVIYSIVWPASHEKVPSGFLHSEDQDQSLYDVENIYT